MSMAFEWKDRYNLGIPEIDKQHQKLFEIGARVYDLAMINDDYDHYDEIMELLQELLNYTEYHFRYEEELMSKYQYSDIGQQKDDHNFYVQKIKSISSRDIDSEQQKTTLEIVDFLSQWISSHITFSDRKYAMEFKAKGITF